MTRRIWLIADDYGLSPGVSASIRELIGQGRLSGTGCMTLFPEWPDEADRLRHLPPQAAIGLHLTLTDQIALSGPSSLAPDGKLPPLGTLVRTTTLNAEAARAAQHELDLQYDRFVEAMGRAPDFLDGHQHVHFLPVARRWLATRQPLAFVRGAPSVRHTPRPVLAKATVVRALACGYDSFLAKRGMTRAGPLAGFYQWDDPNGFAAMLSASLASLPDNALIMCHPGHPDAILAARDRLTAPRAVEHAYLMSDTFAAALKAANVELAGMSR